MVAERLLRDRLGKVGQGFPVAEMKKLRYEEIRKTLILDYRTRGFGMLDEDEAGNPYVWGFEHLDPFFKNRLVRMITTDLLYQFIDKRQGGRGEERDYKPESEPVAKDDQPGAERG